MKLSVFVACERSGVVREAFRKLGHDAYSCDLEPAEDDSQYHIQGDALHWSRRKHWDLMIAHPECRRLCNSGVLRLYKDGKKRNGRDPLKWWEMEQAAYFFRELLYAPIPKICIENSIMHGYAKEIIDPHCTAWERQIIQPNQFGEDASKGTLLTLKNLPRLLPTKYIEPRWVEASRDGQTRLIPDRTGSPRPLIAQWIEHERIPVSLMPLLYSGEVLHELHRRTTRGVRLPMRVVRTLLVHFLPADVLPILPHSHLEWSAPTRTASTQESRRFLGSPAA